MNDLGASRPRKKAGRSPSSRKGTRPGLLRLILACIRLRAMSTLATSVFAAIMVGIVLNATVFQKGHHPAPLFGGPAPSPSVAAAPPPASAVRLQAAQVEPVPASPDLPEPALAAAPVHARASNPPAAKAKDGIGQLLREQAQGVKHSAGQVPVRSAQHSTVPKAGKPTQHVRPGSAHTAAAVKARIPGTMASAAKTL